MTESITSLYLPETNKKRIWLVGCGPSLRDTPLDLLLDEDTMSMNRIHWIWEKVNPKLKWRPKFFFRIDWNEKDVNWQEHTRKGMECAEWSFLWEAFRDGTFKQHGRPHLELSKSMGQGLGKLENVTWLKRCDEHHYYGWDNLTKSLQNWHLPTICTALGSMNPMLQVASLMGYEEIYLLGCDMGWGSDITKNHFHEDYQMYDPRDISKQQNGAGRKLHYMAARCSPVPIYNATIGGELEAYERVDMREVLEDG